MQIHSIKLLPFPELSMQIKIFFKLTFKFPVNTHICRIWKNEKLQKEILGDEGKFILYAFKWILNRASNNRKSIISCWIKTVILNNTIKEKKNHFDVHQMCQILFAFDEKSVLFIVKNLFDVKKGDSVWGNTFN